MTSARSVVVPRWWRLGCIPTDPMGKGDCDGAAGLPGRRGAEGGHVGVARGAGTTPAALPARGQGTQVLPLRRAAAGPRRAGRPADLPGARVAAGGVRGAVRPGTPGHAAGRGDAVLPVRPRIPQTHPAPGPGGEDRPAAARPGRPGALELVAPVGRRAGAGGRLREGRGPGAGPHRRRLGGLLALHRPRPVRQPAAAPAAVLPREQILLLRYRDLRDDPAGTVDRVCAFLGVATGHVAQIPPENVRHYVADTRVNAGLRFLLRNGGRIGHHFPVPVRHAFSGPLLALLHRQHGRRPKVTPSSGPRCCPGSSRRSNCCRRCPASRTPTG